MAQDVPRLIDLRDRALIGTMIYSFARVNAVLQKKVSDYFVQWRRVINDDNDRWLKPAFAEMFRVLANDSFAVSFYGQSRILHPRVQRCWVSHCRASGLSEALHVQHPLCRLSARMRPPARERASVLSQPMRWMTCFLVGV